MRWDLHGIAVQGRTNDATLRRRWQAAFASLPEAESSIELHVSLDVVDAKPAPPAGEPQFRQGDLLHYHVSGNQVTAHFPKYGQLQLDLRAGSSMGRLTSQAVEDYGIVEDCIAIALSPHLRRRGKFLLHAFAAAQGAQALLLVGAIGAGKTTTGMALLQAGWQLLSNDSPILDESGEILSYPGLLAAYPDTMRRFAATRQLAPAHDPKLEGEDVQGQKISVAAEALWPGVWTQQASPGAICFPQVDVAGKHKLKPLSAPETLRRLLPHAIEQWDWEMIPQHLAVLRQLVERAPGYELRLGADVAAIPQFLADGLRF